MTDTKPRFCRHCQGQVRAVRRPVRHWLQVAICVATAGIWLPHYIGDLIDPPYDCPQCGKWAPYRRAKGIFRW